MVKKLRARTDIIQSISNAFDKLRNPLIEMSIIFERETPQVGAKATRASILEAETFLQNFDLTEYYKYAKQIPLGTWKTLISHHPDLPEVKKLKAISRTIDIEWKKRPGCLRRLNYGQE